MKTTKQRMAAMKDRVAKTAAKANARSTRQLNELLDVMSMTQRTAAQLLSTEERTIRRWVSGVTPVPALALMTLRMLRMGIINENDIANYS